MAQRAYICKGEKEREGNGQTSVDAGSVSMKTLYSLLLIAGPIFRSVRAPLRFADFYKHTEQSVSALPLSHPLSLS